MGRPGETAFVNFEAFGGIQSNIGKNAVAD
jgi:hypothetical protein